MSDRTMIWETAKLTAVSRLQMARPSRAATFGSTGRARAAQARSGVAIGLLLDGRRGEAGAGQLRARGGQRFMSGDKCSLEVRDQVVSVLESHRAAEQAGCDPGLGERGIVELAM